MWPIALLGLLWESCPPTPWSSRLLEEIHPWSVTWNDPIVSVTPQGLRIEIGEGRTWAIVAIPEVQFPSRSAAIRVELSEKSPGANWIVKLSQPSGHATQDWLPFGMNPASLNMEADLNPWLRLGLDSPLQYLQLGLEGEAGDFATFERLEVWTRPENPKDSPKQIPRQQGQILVPVIEELPGIPQSLEWTDWKQKAQDYDRFVFDFQARGEFLPLIWWDTSRLDQGIRGFGLPSYVGSDSTGSNHESITTMGAVLGASLVGIDKSKGDPDYVRMCEVYYNDPPHDLVLNRIATRTGQSFWYEIWPNMVFNMLASCYPKHGNLKKILLSTASRWCEAIEVLDKGSGIPDFDYTAFDFQNMVPVDNGLWKEPDAAAGVAWMTYMAHVVSGQDLFLERSRQCLLFLEKRDPNLNPYYEVLLPYGAYLAARANAEQDWNMDTEKLFLWSFGLSSCRPGWGIILGSWNGYDCGGLLGSATDTCGGYAFAMNSFAQAAALVPLVRYDTRFARAVGRWMANLVHACRLFYPKNLPPDLQSCSWWKGDPQGVIAYEGLRKSWQGKSPYAMGDPIVMNWGPKTDLGLYGSGYVGLLGAMVRPTEVQGILQLNLLATDFFHGPAFPSFLYYNPWPETRKVSLDVGLEAKDLYEAVSDRFVARKKKGTVSFSLPSDHAAVIVVVPSKARLRRDPHQVKINDIPVRWNASATTHSPS